MCPNDTDRAPYVVSAVVCPQFLSGHGNGLLDFTAAGGIRLSGLAHRANISKQALGEFVASLEAAGVVDVTPDPGGRPGPAGHADAGGTVSGIEHDLEQRAGAER